MSKKFAIAAALFVSQLLAFPAGAARTSVPVQAVPKVKVAQAVAPGNAAPFNAEMDASPRPPFKGKGKRGRARRGGKYGKGHGRKHRQVGNAMPGLVEAEAVPTGNQCCASDPPM